VNHKFSAENCPRALKTIAANFKPQRTYDSMQKALDEEMEAQLDIFVAGIPCQPFSQSGSGKGFEDEKDGQVFFTVLQFINGKLPRSFVLENVLGLKNHNGGKTFKLIIEKLCESGRYNVHWKIVNTAQNGIPQNRPRVYIVGILKEIDTGRFEWPKEIPPCNVRSL